MSIEHTSFTDVALRLDQPTVRMPREQVAVKAPAISRDTALDVLRGWAILLMIASHVGPNTRVAAIAHIAWYVTAANWFVALSGVVLGMVSARRIVTDGPRTTYIRILERARTLWIIHCVLMFAVVVFHEMTGHLSRVTPVSAVGGWWNVLWMVPTLRLTSNEFMNILPMYVVFLGITPLALECLRRRKTALLLVISFVLYCVAQRFPQLGRIADPISGERIFSVEAWQFVYIGALCVGYHRTRITREFWPRHGNKVLMFCASLFAAIFVFAQLQRRALAPLKCGIPSLSPLFWGKLTASPGQTIYFVATIVVSYWIVRKIETGRSEAMRRFVEPLALIGRLSLYCFLVHLLFALAARALNTSLWPMWEQELLTLGAMAGLYLMARYRVLMEIIPN